MYEDAVQIQPTFKEIFANIANETGGTFSSNLKRIFRALEKTAMKQATDPTLDRADNVCDVVRGMLSYPDFGSMLKGIQATTNHDDVVVMRTKDRFSNPTSGGWMDIVINLTFKSDRNDHVSEIQFVHEGLLAVRKACGGHSAYNSYRSALEMLEVHGVENKKSEAVCF